MNGILTRTKTGTVVLHDNGTGISYHRSVSAKEMFGDVAEQTMDGVIDKLKADPTCEAHFEPEALKAAAGLKEQDFTRYRRKIKQHATKPAILDWAVEVKAARVGDGLPLDATHHTIANDFLDGMEVETGAKPVGFASCLYHYKCGVFVKLSIDALINRLADTYNHLNNCKRAGDYKALAEHTIRLAADVEFFDNAPVGVAAGGRFYRLAAGVITDEPLTPQHRQTMQLPAAPDYRIPFLWQTHLKRCFKGNDEGNQILRVQELFGAVLFRLSAKQQLAFLLYGVGQSGKSTTVEVLEALIDDDFKCGSSPFSWDREYNIAALAGKYLNCVGELDADIPIPAADFKRVIGHDLLEGRHPTHRPFTFRNTAAHIFNSNYLINTRDHSNAFWRRWFILEFNNPLAGSEKNAGFTQNIIDAEASMILAWSFEGAKRLQKNGSYTASAAHDRVMAKWSLQQNSVAEFLDDELVCCKAGAATAAMRLYSEYREWSRAVGRRCMGKQKFYDELRGTTGISRGLLELPKNGSRAHAFSGVTL